MDLSPFDNKIYLTNHGAKGGDWFGEAKYGENYGWKILGWGGTNYTGSRIGPKWKPGLLNNKILGTINCSKFNGYL